MKTNTLQSLTTYIRAGYPGLFITSFEETRVEGMVKSAATTAGFGLFAWSLTKGILDVTKGEEIPETNDPLSALSYFEKTMPEKSILLLRDFHLHMMDNPPSPIIVRALKDCMLAGKASNKTLIVLGARLTLPLELEKEMVAIEFALPDREQLDNIIRTVAEAVGAAVPKDIEKVIDAACGLTTMETENAIAKSVIEHDTVSAQTVYQEKCATVRKNGLLEVVDAGIDLDVVGGLDRLKARLLSLKNLFTQAAREYGLKTPRPMFFVGQAGTGKSLCAQALAKVFGLPLLRLEAGKLFGSLVGQTEQNWRTAFATAKAIAPCILWIDEADGLFRGAQSSGQTDGGTTERVVKTILQDLQFNCDGVFPIFTANDIDGCPDPLIDRCEVWSVELPNAREREDIWRIHIGKREKNAKALKLDYGRLALLTDGFSGRQIEFAVENGRIAAFNENARTAKQGDFEVAAGGMVATSVTMKDVIERRRQRLLNRAQPATSPETKTLTAGPRKLAK